MIVEARGENGLTIGVGRESGQRDRETASVPSSEVRRRMLRSTS